MPSLKERCFVLCLNRIIPNQTPAEPKATATSQMRRSDTLHLPLTAFCLSAFIKKKPYPFMRIMYIHMRVNCSFPLVFRFGRLLRRPPRIVLHPARRTKEKGRSPAFFQLFIQLRFSGVCKLIECVQIVYSKVSKHFAVYFDTGKLKTVH